MYIYCVSQFLCIGTPTNEAESQRCIVFFLLVYQTPVFRISFSDQSEDMITDDPLCESDLTVTEVVYRQLSSKDGGRTYKAIYA
jgi:hypothetical protein